MVLSQSTQSITSSCRPQAPGSSYLLRKHMPCLKHVCCTCHEGEEWTAKAKFLSTQICCNHTGTAQITTAELQRDIIMQMQDKAQSLGHLFNYCFISNQNLEQALQPGVLHLHVVSALKGQSRAYKESGHNRLAAKLKLKPT